VLTKEILHILFYEVLEESAIISLNLQNVFWDMVWHLGILLLLIIPSLYQDSPLKS